jgi:alanine racemase
VRTALAALPPWTTGAVVIDAGRLRGNYRALSEIAAPAECAAVVKADAYGLGARHVVPHLLAEGCRTFFVATLGEGRDVRALAPRSLIYSLGGLLPGTEREHGTLGLRPVLNSVAEVDAWEAYAARQGARLPAAIHLDTGMNRLGVPPAEAAALASRRLAFELALVVSHLACADEPGHAKNAEQIASFAALRAVFPGTMCAFANSAGTIALASGRHDLVRPGIALYGCRSVPETPDALSRAVAIFARVLQTRTILPGQTVGYGATAEVGRPTPAATLGIGYADGFPRAAGHKPFVLRLPDGAPAPLIGRVSMDSIVIDLSASPDPSAISAGDWLAVTGLDAPYPGIDDLADAAGTIGYEVLTRLGPRLQRVIAVEGD